ncbi:putative ankyrin repeat-containing domain [Rosellinia necatrix]|uniref:Putative ankyrin repeat-containing domain n=1 Tax=Rosellinia necatrix TaxID=77044 RepID=A0A1S8A8N2_ROSNE|nr:putative ankyrin repeat-containing domain [Rosellinia necatrix]
MADELREALSITPYEPSWMPDKMINNIYNTLKCCGSLVVIDEEELTARLIHQSVAQFLIEANEETHEWAPTPQEADHFIGEVVVTYLNYSSFEQRLSAKVASTIPVGDTPTKIMETALQPYGLVGQLALAYLQPNTRTKQDIGKALSEASSQYRRKYAVKESFKFLSYASENWLYHTRWIRPSSELYSLWRRLLNNPRFAEPPWSPNDHPPDDIVYDIHDEELEYMWRLSHRATWSIFYSRLPLLSTELRGRHGIKAFCSIMPYLTSLQSVNSNPKFSPEMGELLLRVATMFRASLVTDWLLRIRRWTMDDYCQIIRKAGVTEYKTIRWMMDRPSLLQLGTTMEPLVEIACANHDTQAVRSLIRRGANADLYQTQHPLVIASEALIHSDYSALMLYYLLHSCSLFPSAPSDIYFCLHKLCHTANLDFFNTSASKSEIRPWPWLSPSVFSEYLYHICLRGDYAMAKMLLTYASWSDWKMSLNDLLLAVLHSRSPVRHEVVQLLVQSDPKGSRQCLTDPWIRCVQLRDWASANYLVNRGFKVNNLLENEIQRQNILNLCIDSDDVDGVRFLVDHMGPSQFSPLVKCPTNSQLLFNDTTPLDIVLAKDIPNLQGLCKSMALVIPLASIRCPGPLTDSIIDVAMSWCQQILRTYFLSESQPIDLIEASPNYSIEFVRDLNTKTNALRLLGQLFKPLSCIHSKRRRLLDTLVDILRVYSAGVFAIWTMHNAILDGSAGPKARDTILKSSFLKLEVVKLAKIVLDLHMPRGKDEKEAESISEYIATHLVMTSRHLEGVIEYLLQWYGIRVFGFGLGSAVRDPVQELYSDPLVEAEALGEISQRHLQTAD